ncbi:hypothetical protein C8T65DRAFT_655559 [Cerioporus squamosus]|nr:hypothetical protein C8T65DRAFT_655559 [Cerioporus squamosus]
MSQTRNSLRSSRRDMLSQADSGAAFSPTSPIHVRFAPSDDQGLEPHGLYANGFSARRIHDSFAL